MLLATVMYLSSTYSAILRIFSNILINNVFSLHILKYFDRINR